MAVQFENIEVSVNNSFILASSAIIEEQNNLTVDYTLGNFIPVDVTPVDNLKVTIQLNYTIESNNEPNYQVMKSLVNGTSNISGIYNPQIIVVGGITGYGYLDTYQLKINPNQVITATANYISYTGISGDFIAQPSTNSSQYDTLNWTGLAHYWSSQAIFIDSLGNIMDTGSIIDMDYSFKATWNPIYKIGSQYPVQVMLGEMEEKFDLTTEVITHTSYVSDNTYNIFKHYNSLMINNIGFIFNNAPIFGLSFNMGGVTSSNRINVKLNELITVENTVVKYY